MTEKSKEHLDYTLATLAIEHLTPSNGTFQLCTQVSEGTMNADTAVMAVLCQHWQDSISLEGGTSR